ncbi:GntR family transcriptional regulator [Kitasatospora indigofera]|uniref:GntR family transcriptional regulator n=1 Tax=Kitasatospora indigofera TaxID=67307 RepID=UPI0033BF8465
MAADATPSYLRIADDLRATAQRSAAGTRMPSISTLGTEHGVSAGVVQRAYAVLVEEGLVLARPGAGYYVRSQEPPEVMVRRPRAASGEGSPTAAILAEQGVAGTWRSESSPVRASAETAGRLEIPAGDPVMHTSYVYLADGVPLMLAESWEPMAVTGGSLIVLPEAGPHAGIGVADRMALIGIDVGMPVERVTARTASRTEAAILAVAPAVPVLAVVRTYFDQATGRPVETADVVMLGSRWVAEYGARPGQ